MSETSAWKRPMEFNDFATTIAKPISFVDSSGSKISFKDSAKDGKPRLRAKVKMTFAGRETLNHSIYLPDQMYTGANTFLKPFNKPVLRHHETEKDAIGRVIDIRYIDTFNEAMGFSDRLISVASVFKDKNSNLRRRLDTVAAFLDASENPSYMGAGHLLGIWDITDAEAIEKILDGRYSTVSTDFKPKGAYCSTCVLEGELTDWRTDDCDHSRGQMVDGRVAVAIPYGFMYKEASFVNVPAAPAFVLETGEDLSFSDAVSKTNYSIPHEIISDVILDTGKACFNAKGSAVSKLPENFSDYLQVINPTQTSKSKVIGDNEQGGAVGPQGSTMFELSELTKDTESNYAEIIKHLGQDAAQLTGDLLKDLEDSAFIGPNRTFPVKDLCHANAIKALLGEVKDSESKSALLEILESKMSAFEVSPETDAAAAEEPVVAATEQDAETFASAEPKDLDTQLTELGLAKITTDALVKLNAEVDDLKTSKAIWQQRIQSLETEVRRYADSQTELVKSYKDLLASQLLDNQIARGMRIKDKEETLKKYKSKTLESLKDSLADLSDFEEDGLAREASGEQVTVGDFADSASSADQKKLNEQYHDILSTYWEKFYSGPRGAAHAENYLNEQKRQGLIPVNLVP